MGRFGYGMRPAEPKLPMLRGHGLRVLSLAFSADGKRLVSTSDEGGQLLVWDVQQASALNSLYVGQGLITSILFSQDGAVLGTVGYNGTSRLQLLDQDRFRTLQGASAANKSLAFLSAGRIVSITDQNTLAVIAPNEPQAKAADWAGWPAAKCGNLGR